MSTGGTGSSDGGVKAAVITGIFAVIVAVIGASTSWFGLGKDSEASPPTPTTEATTPPVSSSTPPTTAAGLFTEYADNRAGSPVYKDPVGHAPDSLPARIPFDTAVDVDCWVPDESGQATVTAFYHIVTGDWAGHYVVTDTMSNGGPPGNTDSPSIDPQVPEC